jgi:dihydrofolate reductase
MGILIATEFMALDGVAQAPGGPEEDPEDGFAYGGWQAPFHDEATGRTMFEQASGMDALLLGRKTYDIFAGYWPTAPEDMPFTGLLNRVPKYVASRTLSEPLSWHNTTLLGGDLRAAIDALKERHGEVHLIGSLDLGRSLLAAGLVDRLDLWVYPVVLGRGKRLFGDETMPAALRLTDSVTTPNGTVHLTYEQAGQPTVGVMGAG